MIKDENYFDNCATTKTDPAYIGLTSRFLTEEYFNPSSLSKCSTNVFFRLEEARKTILSALGGENGNLIFTASGSEADNTAIFGTFKRGRGNVVSSLAEHPAVYNTLKSLADSGEDVRYAPLNPDGSVNVRRLCEVVDEKTQLVSLMHVNNETGAITDIKAAVKAVKAINPKALVMSDGVQAFMKLPVNVEDSGVDMYSISAHKIHAPKGVGALWVKKGVNVRPLIFGGGQERGLRGGTENVAGIIAFAEAVSDMKERIRSNAENYEGFRRIILDKLSVFDDLLIPCENGAANVLSLFFKDIKTEVIMHMTEDEGFIVGTGSACSSKHRTNRIAQAIELPKCYHEGLVRISFSKYNTEASVEALAEALKRSLMTFRGKK